MSDASDISAIVVHYGAPRDTAAALERLRAAGVTDIVLVDNGPPEAASPDAATPGVRVLRNAENIGFAAAVNRGLPLAKNAFVFLVNPDAEFDAAVPAALARVLRDDPRAGIVSARLVNPDGSPQPFCSAFPTLGRQVLHMTGLKRLVPERWRAAARDGDAAFETDWVVCAACLLRREAASAVGGFDEDYFFYGEDMDLCRRLRTAGWRVLVAPDAVVRHEGNPGDILRNGLFREAVVQGTTQRFFAKHRGPLRAAALRAFHAAISCARWALWAIAREVAKSRREQAVRKMAVHAECVRQALRGQAPRRPRSSRA